MVRVSEINDIFVNLHTGIKSDLCKIMIVSAVGTMNADLHDSVSLIYRVYFVHLGGLRYW